MRRPSSRLGLERPLRPSRLRPALPAAVALLLAACSTAGETQSTSSTTASVSASGTGGAGGTGAAGGAGGEAPIGGDRPVEVSVPSSLPPGEKAPLVLLLHGYSVSGPVESLYLGLGLLVEQKKFFYAYPTGTRDFTGNPFWNATDVCCDFGGSGVDDDAYLTGVIDEIIARYPVDPKRVYLVGHSNGAFMSYRLACNHADKIAAIVSLAGAMWNDPSKCQPSGPVHVLEVHGTADDTVLYEGSATGPGPAPGGYPSAQQSVADWVTFDGCDPTPDDPAPSASLDLVTSLPGADTKVQRWKSKCKPGGSGELWTIEGGEHIPLFTAAFRDQVIDYLFAHPKP